MKRRITDVIATCVFAAYSLLAIKLCVNHAGNLSMRFEPTEGGYALTSGGVFGKQTPYIAVAVLTVIALLVAIIRLFVVKKAMQISSLAVSLCAILLFAVVDVSFEAYLLLNYSFGITETGAADVFKAILLTIAAVSEIARFGLISWQFYKKS